VIGEEERTMKKQEHEKTAQMMRLAIPAAVCLVAVVVVVLGTRVWVPGLGQGPSQPIDLRGDWLGMRLASTGSQSAAELGIPPEVNGVVVANVQPNSRALSAGLSAGDVVARINGTSVANLIDLYKLSTKLDVARPLQVDFLRAGKPMTVIVSAADGMTAATGITPAPALGTSPTSAGAASGVGQSGGSTGDTWGSPRVQTAR
jgi:membrane-associated protease RseP (regulator of RpoE activity)